MAQAMVEVCICNVALLNFHYTTLKKLLVTPNGMI